jgi:hypothetical protein
MWTLSAMPDVTAFGGEESVEGLSIGRQARLPVLWRAAGATGRKPRRHEGGRLVGDCKGNDHPFGVSRVSLPSGSSSRCVSGVTWEFGDAPLQFRQERKALDFSVAERIICIKYIFGM